MGHTILKSGELVIAKENVKRFKNSIRKITKRNRGVSFEQVVSELNLNFEVGLNITNIPRVNGCFETWMLG